MISNNTIKQNTQKVIILNNKEKNRLEQDKSVNYYSSNEGNFSLEKYLAHPIIYSSVCSDDDVLNGYLHIIQKLIKSEDKKYINNITKKDLIEKNAFIVPVFYLDESVIQIVGGFYFTIDELQSAYLGGVVVDPRYRGRTSIHKLISSTIDLLFSLNAAIEFTIVVRQLPDGNVNPKASKLFQSIGFKKVGTRKFDICGLNPHLLDSEEIDGGFYAVEMKLVRGV